LEAGVNWGGLNVDAWDYIVIGAGSSGCAVANRLSANPKTKVLLLEAGGSDKGLNFEMVSLGYLNCAATQKRIGCSPPNPIRRAWGAATRSPAARAWRLVQCQWHDLCSRQSRRL